MRAKIRLAALALIVVLQVKQARDLDRAARLREERAVMRRREAA